MTTMCRNVSTYVICRAALLRDGIKRILGKTRFRVVGAGPELKDCKLSSRVSKPVLFILFDEDHDQTDETVRAIRESAPDSRIVVLTPVCRRDHLMAIFRLGVHAYLANTISADALIKSLDVVMADGIVLPSASFTELVQQEIRVPAHVAPIPAQERSAALLPPVLDAKMPALSDREALILQALVTGDSNKHIARRLAIAEATVKVHVKAILRKIRVRNRTQAAIWAMSNSMGHGTNGSEARSSLLSSTHADDMLGAAAS